MFVIKRTNGALKQWSRETSYGNYQQKWQWCFFGTWNFAKERNQIISLIITIKAVTKQLMKVGVRLHTHRRASGQVPEAHQVKNQSHHTEHGSELDG